MGEYRQIISITVWAEDKKLEDIVMLKPSRSLKKKIGKKLNEQEYIAFKKELEEYKTKLEKKFNPERYVIHTPGFHHLYYTKSKS